MNKAQEIIGKVSRIILFNLLALLMMAVIASSILHLGWKAIYVWGGLALWTFLVYSALAWREGGE